MKEYITRNEAANIVGCHPQTITNYAAKGLITSREKDNNLYIDRASLYEFIEHDFRSIVRSEEAVRDYIEIRDDEVEKLREEIASIRDIRSTLNTELAIMKMMSSGSIARNLEAVVNACIKDESLSPRSLRIIHMLFQLRSPDAIKNELVLSRERVYQLTRRILVNIAKKMRDSYDTIEKVEKLREENKSLRSCINKMYKMIPHDMQINTDKEIEKAKMLSAPLTSLELSVRSINVLRTLGAITLYDVMQIPKEDIMHVRNAGKRTVAEIEDLKHDVREKLNK